MRCNKVVHIIGARPQFVKYFPVQLAEQRANLAGAGIKDVLVHTGQHYDYAMSRVFFDELGIKEPDYHLGVGSGLHGAQTATALEKIERVLLDERPHSVVVYGDTNTTLAGSLAAVKLHVPLVHVEAGLRSYNMRMPEEVNRVLSDHASTLLLCPSKRAVENLAKEGIGHAVLGGELLSRDCRELPQGLGSARTVLNVGDVMYDMLTHAYSMAEKRSSVLDRLNLEKKGYSIITLHRAENTEDSSRIIELADFAAKRSGGLPIVFPAHPRTKKALEGSLGSLGHMIKVIEPLGYFDMIWLLGNARTAFSDSGGLQKEALWLKVPCVTLRDETEWVETVESGWNVLYKDFSGVHAPCKEDLRPYGDAGAAGRIVECIKCLSRESK